MGLILFVTGGCRSCTIYRPPDFFVMTFMVHIIYHAPYFFPQKVQSNISNVLMRFGRLSSLFSCLIHEVVS